MMKRFVKKLSIFTIVFFLLQVAIVLFHYLVIGNQYEGEYTGSFVSKMERLESIDEPKIILVGNSNVAYGFQSELIEVAFGRPVVNIGFHGGMGSKFHEDMLQGNVNSGDIVVLCDSDFGISEHIADYRLAWVTFEWHTDYWWLIGKKDYWNMIKTYPNYFVNAVALWITREGKEDVGCSRFNQYGDVALYRPNNTENIYGFGQPLCPSYDMQYIDRINALNKYIVEQGAVLVVAGYPIGYSGEISEESLEELEAFGKNLDTELDCIVISDYSEYVFSYEYFFDSTLHLSSEGAKIRTEKLIEDMEEYFYALGIEE